MFRDGALLLPSFVVAAWGRRWRWRHVAVVPAPLGTAWLAPHGSRTSGGFTVTVGFGASGWATTTTTTAATAAATAILLVLLLLVSSAAAVPSIPTLRWGVGVETGLTLGGFSFADLLDFFLAFFKGNGFALGFGEEFGL